MEQVGLALTLLGLVCWALALHPFVSYPLSLLLLRPLARPGTPEPTVATGDVPLVSFCTCAYNEVRIIEAKIQNLLALKERYPNLEVLLYVDGASDGTSEIASRYADQISLHVSHDRHGKTYGMNLLVSRARGQILAFTDANVMVDLEAPERLAAHFADPLVGCVCGNLIYTNSAASVTAATGSLYWRLEQFIKRRESLRGSVMGADGSIFAIRKVLHCPPPDDIIDDMFVSFRVLCAGFSAIQVEDVRAYEESVTAAPEEFRRKVRIACQAFNAHRLIWSMIRARFSGLRLYMYISHKLLRWFSIYLLALGCLFWLIGLIALGQGLAAAIAVIICCVAQWTGLRFKVPVLSPVADILSSLTGAGIGVWRSIRGERYQIWQPAASIRQ